MEAENYNSFWWWKWFGLAVLDLRQSQKDLSIADTNSRGPATIDAQRITLCGRLANPEVKSVHLHYLSNNRLYENGYLMRVIVDVQKNNGQACL